MSSREAFEKDAENDEYMSLDRDPSGQYCDRETQIAWESWKAATERAAVLAWGVGMIHYKGSLQDSREIGSKCARAIREGNE